MSNKETPVAVVTGAGTGIGRATALALAQAGHRVALAGRRHEPLEAVASEIASKTGGRSRTLVLPTDVADPAQVQAMIEGTVREFGRLDTLINNAGCGELLPIDKTDLATLRRTFNTNALGPALAIHLAWPIFTKQKSGCVVNVSTAGTDDPFVGLFAYAASKAGVNLMARSCAKEGKWIGVRAFAVAPGAVETGLLRRLFDDATMPTEVCLTPEQVAKVIVECVSGKRDAQNGRTILVVRAGDGTQERVL